MFILIAGSQEGMLEDFNLFSLFPATVVLRWLAFVL